MMRNLISDNDLFIPIFYVTAGLEVFEDTADHFTGRANAVGDVLLGEPLPDHQLPVLGLGELQLARFDVVGVDTRASGRRTVEWIRDAFSP